MTGTPTHPVPGATVTGPARRAAVASVASLVVLAACGTATPAASGGSTPTTTPGSGVTSGSGAPSVAPVAAATAGSGSASGTGAAEDSVTAEPSAPAPASAVGTSSTLTTGAADDPATPVAGPAGRAATACSVITASDLTAVGLVQSHRATSDVQNGVSQCTYAGTSFLYTIYVVSPGRGKAYLDEARARVSPKLAAQVVDVAGTGAVLSGSSRRDPQGCCSTRAPPP